MFRGLLDSRARSVDMSMKVARARAIAGIVAEAVAIPYGIAPSIFDARVVPAVTEEVQSAAVSTGLGRRPAPVETAIV